MTKFQKIQRYLCFIPFISTFFIMIVTMIELKRHKANFLAWVKYALIFFGSGIAVFVLNELLMTGEHPVLNVIASTALLALANLMMVDLQYKCTVNAEKQPPQSPVDESDSRPVHSRVNRKMIKMIAICCIPFVIMVAFVSWQISSMLQWHREQTIPDVNGDSDFSLNTLTEEDILAEWYDYTMYAFGSSGEGNSTDVDGDWEDEDYDLRSMTAQSFSGVTVLQSTKTDRETLTLDITSTVESGNFRILITVDGAYYCDVDINQTVRVVLDDIQNKTVLVKIAGESAEFDAEAKRTY